jgi:capsule polysaccharide export protein KpsE/RkpR
MANAYIEVLDRFNRDVRMTKGRRTREFVGKRLQDTDSDLHAAEETFAQYQSTHKTPPLSPDASSALSSIAGMYAQREALQVRLGVIQGYTQGESDEATQLRAELAQLDRRLAAVPETGMESLRLLRELKTLEQLRALLTAQYEQARIDEVRDVATLEPLDVASVPEKRARPKRALLTLTGLFLGLGAGIAIALLEPERPQPA